MRGVDRWCVDGRCVDTGAWMGCVWTVNKGTNDVDGRGCRSNGEPCTISNIAVVVGVMRAISWF
ncbi:hypothetical protein F2Q69_00019462 [Brassica cretica]|uniref:Uncharacterized protein n=1 Tax=Brassica cretica TaxID=69181 RepID=A0A8S9QIY9_BRACR|nr:hypothetical protein F2Q69_00019462 [Brassica cretica]